ncbi:(d)CMP kinase [Sphingomicrobium sediminis]|uniref:Cytidylate kinase n=1 Tax=Sphingomicrobium sediminis TaxID=2950949 RepID=A0A9X2EIG0_9SPHN|nr:d(CMP) kinase [Sphingomicrobium sediminis]MCM8557356.1 cytidylate kinase [Sphingomicrobium sediminis]
MTESSKAPLVIAVDGPAASGKGTIAKALARHYDLPHMDTGLLYRGVALSLFRFGGDPGNPFEAVRAIGDLDQVDPDDEELRSETVGEIASRVSAYPAVRQALLERQQAFAAQSGGAVLDGRDIGTVIAPDATAKLFVTAAPEVRAERRYKELIGRELDVHLEDVLLDIRARDARDAGRDAAPLVQAEDADLLDTSEMSIERAVQRAIELVEARLQTS